MIIRGQKGLSREFNFFSQPPKFEVGRPPLRPTPIYGPEHDFFLLIIITTSVKQMDLTHVNQLINGKDAFIL